jgi:4-hydroxy-tetrahydrodipicolinate reductase
MSLRIVLHGYGRMGKAVELEAVARGHQIVGRINTHNLDEIADFNRQNADAIIEFTHPDGVVATYHRLIATGLPVIAGTTGWHSALHEVEQAVLFAETAFLHSSNFSPGVNILFRLNSILAAMMNRYPDYDPYIEEAHHRHKKDAPSGTALSLAHDLIDGLDRKTSWEYAGFAQRPPEASELSIGVTRAGEIIGKHAVAYRSEIEEIRISHEAFNRRGFALGAVLAAEWLQGKQGFFTFAEIFE